MRAMSWALAHTPEVPPFPNHLSICQRREGVIQTRLTVLPRRRRSRDTGPAGEKKICSPCPSRSHPRR